MATLSIRNLPDDVHQRLRLRAARKGRSMEAEVRDILAQTCVPSAGDSGWEGIQDFVDRIYGGRKPGGVVDDLIRERRREARQE